MHLLNQNEVDYAVRWREQCKWNGATVPFTVKLFDEPPRVVDRGDYRDDYGGDYRGGEHAPTKNRPANKAELERKPTTSKSDLDALYGPSQPSSLESVTAPTLKPSLLDESLVSMPIFNKRLVERKRIEEEAAAAAMAAAEATELEKRIEEEQKANLERRLQRDAKLERRRQREAKKVKSMTTQQIIDVSPSSSPHLSLNESGCCRLEGFHKQQADEKIIYLADFSSIPKPAYDPTSATTTSSSTGRSTRAQNRRLLSSMDSLGSDFFGKGSAFSARQKKLILGRSSIHSWGLFAGEDVEVGDFVIEYVGEVIRLTVANIRERRYELWLRARGSTEMASSYFFRLDSTMAVDATHKGNLARFINHSCDPTCVARIMVLDGKQRIVFYTRRDIRCGEEITYDYKFPLEDDPAKKIKCLCGAKTCRGTLN